MYCHQEGPHQLRISTPIGATSARVCRMVNTQTHRHTHTQTYTQPHTHTRSSYLTAAPHFAHTFMLCCVCLRACEQVDRGTTDSGGTVPQPHVCCCRRCYCSGCAASPNTQLTRWFVQYAWQLACLRVPSGAGWGILSHTLCTA